MSRKANTSTNATTGGRCDLSSSAPSIHWAVRLVTPASASGSAPTVVGTISSRRTARGRVRFVVRAVPLDRHGDVRDRPRLVAFDGDGLVHPPAGQRPLLEPPDRSLRGGRVYVGRLDDHGGRERLARKRILHPVVGLYDRQGL